MIDESALYKRMCFRATEIQDAWVPEPGDFWHCACGNCLTSNAVWIIERADTMAIDPKYTFENLKLHYSRDVFSAVMTSRDCGFGPFWFNWKAEGQLGHVWLPRFDQLLNFAKKSPSLADLSEVDILDRIAQYARSISHMIDSTISLQQLTLQWIMDIVYNKRYKENSDHPIIQDEPEEPIVVPENLTEEMAMFYKMVRSPRKRCGGAWFEIKTA